MNKALDKIYEHLEKEYPNIEFGPYQDALAVYVNIFNEYDHTLKGYFLFYITSMGNGYSDTLHLHYHTKGLKEIEYIDINKNNDYLKAIDRFIQNPFVSIHSELY